MLLFSDPRRHRKDGPPRGSGPLPLTDGGSDLTPLGRHVRAEHYWITCWVLLNACPALVSWRVSNVQRWRLPTSRGQVNFRTWAFLSLRASVSVQGLHGAVNVLGPTVAHLTGSSYSSQLWVFQLLLRTAAHVNEANSHISSVSFLIVLALLHIKRWNCLSICHFRSSQSTRTRQLCPIFTPTKNC